MWTVSIHAPLAGCDSGCGRVRTAHSGFNPRTPRGVRQHATTQTSPPSSFNPRTPRGVRHAATPDPARTPQFQSTHPSRGATELQDIRNIRINVSIHAPLAGCDLHERLTLLLHAGFQSTHPSRGATKTGAISRASRSFQSTHPSRGATCEGTFYSKGKFVSIHAPLAGCDGKRSHKGNILPRIYGCYSPQIRFFSAVRPTPLLWHGSSTYILSCDFLFTSPSRS